jgi:hypothetical protein
MREVNQMIIKVEGLEKTSPKFRKKNFSKDISVPSLRASPTVPKNSIGESMSFSSGQKMLGAYFLILSAVFKISLLNIECKRMQFYIRFLD